jgi:hypothetical protein
MNKALRLGLLGGRAPELLGNGASPVPCLERLASGLVRSTLGIFSIGGQISCL